MWGRGWLAAVMTGGLGAMVATSHAQDAMEAHVDPTTGVLVPEPIGPVARPLPAPLETPVEMPAPGGGMMVHLGGRFMSSLVATVDGDGQVHIDCVTEDRR